MEYARVENILSTNFWLMGRCLYCCCWDSQLLNVQTKLSSTPPRAPHGKKWRWKVCEAWHCLKLRSNAKKFLKDQQPLVNSCITWNLVLVSECCVTGYPISGTGSSRLMRISLLWFFKTITISWLMWFYGLFVLLLRTWNKNFANVIFGQFDFFQEPSVSCFFKK